MSYANLAFLCDKVSLQGEGTHLTLSLAYKEGGFVSCPSLCKGEGRLHQQTG